MGPGANPKTPRPGMSKPNTGAGDGSTLIGDSTVNDPRTPPKGPAYPVPHMFNTGEPQASTTTLEKAPPENTITTIVIGVALLASIIGLILGTGDSYTLGLVATGLAGVLGGSTMQSVRR